MLNEPFSVFGLEISAEAVDRRVASVPKVLDGHSHTVNKCSAVILFCGVLDGTVENVGAFAYGAFVVAEALGVALIVDLSEIDTAITVEAVLKVVVFSYLLFLLL